MKKSIKLFTILIIIISIDSCKKDSEKRNDQITEYVPVDEKLFEEITAMDKVFFDAYNNCDLEKQASIYSDDIEFFHDKGGLITSKEELLEGTRNNICGKVTRELIEGSIEVYPIQNYGAVQIGLHKFHNNQEPDAKSKPSKFITVWHYVNEKWQMSKVISLH